MGLTKVVKEITEDLYRLYRKDYSAAYDEFAKLCGDQWTNWECGYGIYGFECYTMDGKYYAMIEIGGSCD